jgi:hypothetical protein
MADESASAEPRAGDPLAARLDRPLTELTVDELMELKAEFEARGIPVCNSASPELLMLLAATAIYSKAFLETLAKHHAEGLIEAVRSRFRKNGKATELLVGPGDGEAATLVITSDTLDEARLAVLDLDVTAGGCAWPPPAMGRRGRDMASQRHGGLVVLAAKADLMRQVVWW